jgi:hypothetical protein
MSKKLFRPTNLEIKPTSSGFQVVAIDGDINHLLFEYNFTWNIIEPSLSLEEAEEFAKYLIEYYNYNHH